MPPSRKPDPPADGLSPSVTGDHYAELCCRKQSSQPASAKSGGDKRPTCRRDQGILELPARCLGQTLPTSCARAERALEVEVDPTRDRTATSAYPVIYSPASVGMSDVAMSRFLADTPIGGVVAVQARHLGLSNEEFDSAVKGWLAVGGGPGFIAIRGNRETRKRRSPIQRDRSPENELEVPSPRSASQARRRAGVVIA